MDRFGSACLLSRPLPNLPRAFRLQAKEGAPSLTCEGFSQFHQFQLDTAAPYGRISANKSHGVASLKKLEFDIDGIQIAFASILFEAGIKEHDGHGEHFCNSLQATCRDAVRAFFVFLNLLECEIQVIREHHLGHTAMQALSADTSSDLCVSWILSALFHFSLGKRSCDRANNDMPPQRPARLWMCGTISFERQQSGSLVTARGIERVAHVLIETYFRYNKNSLISYGPLSVYLSTIAIA